MNISPASRRPAHHEPTHRGDPISSRARPRRAPAALILISSLAFITGGCAFMGVIEDQEFDGTLIRFHGSVSTTRSGAGPRIALLIKQPESGELVIMDHYVLERDGDFYFVSTHPGTFFVAAFQDTNSNFVYDRGEPAYDGRETTYTIAAGDTIEGIEIEIQPSGRGWAEAPVDIRAEELQGFEAEYGYTTRQLSHSGEVVELSEPRFGRASGELGLWNIMDFLYSVGQGLYFLEPYDARKIPVLFVHGIGGNPQEFTHLIDLLDRDRFQPWFYFYASGEYLGKTAELLTRTLTELRLEHGFERLFVVAHSMGGLVSRESLLNYHETTGHETIPLFVTISTPWGGHAAAEAGVKHAPVVVYSWRDVAPGSRFLNRLFFRDEKKTQPRRLPDHMSYHLLFGHRRKANLPGVSGDGVVSVASELRPEAQVEAETIFGFDADHTQILRLDETATLLNEILEDAAK